MPDETRFQRCAACNTEGVPVYQCHACHMIYCGECIVLQPFGLGTMQVLNCVSCCDEDLLDESGRPTRSFAEEITRA